MTFATPFLPSATGCSVRGERYRVYATGATLFLCVVRHRLSAGSLALPLALVRHGACSCTHPITERHALVCCPFRLRYVLSSPHAVQGTRHRAVFHHRRPCEPRRRSTARGAVTPARARHRQTSALRGTECRTCVWTDSKSGLTPNLRRDERHIDIVLCYV